MTATRARRPRDRRPSRRRRARLRRHARAPRRRGPRGRHRPPHLRRAGSRGTAEERRREAEAAARRSARRARVPRLRRRRLAHRASRGGRADRGAAPAAAAARPRADAARPPSRPRARPPLVRDACFYAGLASARRSAARRTARRRSSATCSTISRCRPSSSTSPRPGRARWRRSTPTRRSSSAPARRRRERARPRRPATAAATKVVSSPRVPAGDRGARPPLRSRHRRRPRRGVPRARPARGGRPARPPARGLPVRIGISCYPTFGGSGVVATELAALAAGGDEVHVISYALPPRWTWAGPRLFFHEVVVPHYPLFEYPPYALALATKMVEVARHQRLDLLHVHYAVPNAVSGDPGAPDPGAAAAQGGDDAPRHRHHAGRQRPQLPRDHALRHRRRATR